MPKEWVTGTIVHIYKNKGYRRTLLIQTNMSNANHIQNPAKINNRKTFQNPTHTQEPNPIWLYIKTSKNR